MVEKHISNYSSNADDASPLTAQAAAIENARSLKRIIAQGVCDLAESLSNAFGASLGHFEPDSVDIPAKVGDASIYIGDAHDLSRELLDGVFCRNMPKYGGISLFKAAFIRSAYICFIVSDELLAAFAEPLAASLVPKLPSELLIPAHGVAVDSSAAGYVRALLLAYHRVGRACDCSDASHSALLRCLMLFDTDLPDYARMTSAAVRAALLACECASPGGAAALVMASALEYAGGFLS